MKERSAVAKTRGAEPAITEVLDTYKKIIGQDSILVSSTGGDLFRFLNDASGSRAKDSGFANMVASAEIQAAAANQNDDAR